MTRAWIGLLIGILAGFAALIGLGAASGVFDETEVVLLALTACVFCVLTITVASARRR